MNARAQRTPVQITQPGPVGLAAWADQHLAVGLDPAQPGTGAAVRVDLPRATAITGHLSPGSSVELCERLGVLGQIASLRDRVDHLPADDAGLVDDERASGGDAPLIIEDTVRLGHLTMRPEIGQQPELVAFLVG